MPHLLPPRPLLTDAELTAWWAALHHRREAFDAAPFPVKVTGPKACERCQGTGWVKVRWIGRVRCGGCYGHGWAAEGGARGGKGGGTREGTAEITGEASPPSPVKAKGRRKG